LRKLAKALHDENSFNYIEDEFKNQVTEDSQKGGELTNQLKSFFGKLCENENGEEPTTLRVLKVVHQQTILSGYTLLKGELCPQLGRSFKDTPGGWAVLIEIHSDKIRVIHRKLQQSSNLENPRAKEFEFAWELRIEFDRSVTQITKIECEIVNFRIDETLPASEQKRIRHIFNHNRKWH